MMFTSYDLFGTKVTPTTQDDLLSIVHRHVETERQCVIASQNLHGLYVGLSDRAFKRLHSFADTYVHIDGMPIVWLCKLRGIGAVRDHRVTLVDWIWPLLSRAASEGWKVYYLGGSDEMLEAGRRVIIDRLPLLRLRTHNGFFAESDRAASDAIVADIAAYRPQLVLVGMGMGRQERWILENLRDLPHAPICTVGACMEYISGDVRTPPRWMGRAGLEWLFRFVENPSRFWYRYTVEPFYVVSAIVDWVFYDSLSREAIYRSNEFARVKNVTEAAAVLSSVVGGPSTVSAV